MNILELSNCIGKVVQEVSKEAVGNCLTKKRDEKAGRKHRLTLAHDGPGRQTRGCYMAVATALGASENASHVVVFVSWGVLALGHVDGWV